MNNYCRFCNASGGDRIALLDGSMLHQSCYNEILNQIDQINNYVQTLDGRIKKTDSKVLTTKSFVRRINAFFEKRSIKPSANEILQKNSSNLKSERKIMFEKRSAFTNLLSQIYDVWPTYPPDWSERQERARTARGKSCSSCGSSGPLDIHHLRPIREGGTHRVDNLALLCRECHEDAHGGRHLSYSDVRSDEFYKTNVEKRIKKIRFCIEQSKQLRFAYISFDGKQTQRTVRPATIRKLTAQEIKRLTGKIVEREPALCMFGYCYLRSGIRCFRISRMSRLIIQRD